MGAGLPRFPLLDSPLGSPGRRVAKACPVPRALKVSLECRVPKACKVSRVLLAHKDRLGPKALLVPKAPKGCKDHRECRVPRGILGLRALLAPKGPKAFRVCRAPLAHKVPKDSRGTPGPKDHRAPKVTLAPKDFLEPPEQTGRLDHRVLLALKGPRDLLGHRETRVSRGHRVSRVHRVRLGRITPHPLWLCGTNGLRAASTMPRLTPRLLVRLSARARRITLAPS